MRLRMLKEGSSLLLCVGQDARQKNNGNARVSDTDSDDLSINTGKTRPFRAGRADSNLRCFWDRAQILESEIQSELLQLATNLMEQSCLIEWPSAKQDDDVVFGSFARKFRRRAIQHKRFFGALCTCDVDGT